MLRWNTPRLLGTFGAAGLLVLTAACIPSNGASQSGGATGAAPAAATSGAASGGASTPAAGAAAGASTPAAAAGGQANDQQLVAQGQELFTKYGCNACHSTTGAKIVGPPLNGLAGEQVTLDNGQTVTADDNYLRESITDPDAKTTQGYPKSVMAATIAPHEAEIKQDDNLNALVAYIKSLK